MAIAGLLVHTLKDATERVEAQIGSMPEMTTYGTHDGQYVVVVAEAPAEAMEGVVERLNELDGILAVYTTYVTIEDEWTDGSLPVPEAAGRPS